MRSRKNMQPTTTCPRSNRRWKTPLYNARDVSWMRLPPIAEPASPSEKGNSFCRFPCPNLTPILACQYRTDYQGQTGCKEGMRPAVFMYQGSVLASPSRTPYTGEKPSNSEIFVMSA